MKNKFKIKNADDFALYITDKVGTVGFFATIVIWTLLWLGWNTFAPVAYRFDPFPAFVLWLFISNMIQIFLMPLILIGQNVQTKAMENLTVKDYDLDVKAELEIQEIKELLKQLLKNQQNQNK